MRNRYQRDIESIARDRAIKEHQSESLVESFIKDFEDRLTDLMAENLASLCLMDSEKSLREKVEIK